MNGLRIEASSSLTAYKAELAKVTREIDRLINAITDGVAVSQVKDKMLALDLRKGELELLIKQTDEPPALLHPNMAIHYRNEIARLHQVLNDDQHRQEAAEIIRTLVEKIVLQPVTEDAQNSMSIELHGDLAGILSLSAQTQKPPQKGGDFEESTKLVAGAGNRRYLSNPTCMLNPAQLPTGPVEMR